MHVPENTAVRAVVHSPGKAAPLGGLCLRVGAFTGLALSSRLELWSAILQELAWYQGISIILN